MEKVGLIKVLVTGAGGTFGEATIRSLRKSNLETKIIAADCAENSSGFYLADKYYLLPKVESKEYLETLVKICLENSIDVIFIASGAEIPIVSKLREKIEELSGSFLIVNSPDLLDITEDKWKTYIFLRQSKIELPKSTISKDYKLLFGFAKEVNFPIIVKPRIGKGSKGISICRNMDSLFTSMNSKKEMIAQMLVGTKEEEYTVGVLGTEEGDILSSISLRRDLDNNGMTVFAEVVDNELIKDYSEKIVSLLKPRGYCNVQLRLHNGRPYAFEINGRISSSTGFRTTAGFNEPEIILRHYFLKQNIKPEPIKKVEMVRINNEILLS